MDTVSQSNLNCNQPYYNTEKSLLWRLAILSVKLFVAHSATVSHTCKIGNSKGFNDFDRCLPLVSFGTPQINLGAASDPARIRVAARYLTLFGTLDGFEDYYKSLTQNEFIQLLGRMRAHRYPDEAFSFYLVGTGLDPQFLAELGCDLSYAT